MSDIREALVALIQGPIAWARGEAEDIADAILDEFDVTERGDDPREVAHIECDCVPDLGPPHCHLCGERRGAPVPWTTAHPAPSVEDVARAILMVTQVADVDPDYAWNVQYPEVQDELLDQARAVLALFPGRTEAEVKAEALREAADEIDALYFGPDQNTPFSTGAKHKWGATQAAKRLRDRADANGTRRVPVPGLPLELDIWYEPEGERGGDRG